MRLNTILPVANDTPQAQPSALDASRILGDFGIAAFLWSAETDEMTWSSGASRLLDAAGATPPSSGRAFLRLIDPETAPVRAAAVPAFGTIGPADALNNGYTVRYRLKADVGTDRWIEETGRWMEGPDGRLRYTEAWLRTVVISPDEAHPSGSPARLPREALIQELDRTIEALKQDRQGSTAFLVVAVDDLSRINANFGYDIGDRIIETVAERIGRRMRNGDVLGRLSGHKFGAILRNCSELMITIAADRFRRAVSEELIVTSEAHIEARVSIGAVIAPRNARDGETASVRAEEALAEARTTSEGIAIYQPSPERDRARRENLALAEEILKGLADDRFVLAYQPIISATTGETIAYEALCRLIGTDGRAMSAAALIATAERLGLIRRIDFRTLSLSLADLAANPRLRLSVNASVGSATDPQWLGAVMDAIAADRSIAGRLTVEITETSAITDMTAMTRVVQTLRDVGCKVAIDDFGAGHTSFKALRDLELDRVKIDGSYVADIASNPDSVVFVKALVALADHFSIATVAEWVQDARSADILRQLGVKALQGRYAGEPKLRVMPQTAAILQGAGVLASPDRDGYRSSAGLLEGPLACAAG